jgi:starch-binding outer membrane protein, SusD/RagB family
LLVPLLLLASCQKYLDVKPDKQMAVATTLKDAQALLDNYGLLNNYYPSIGDQSDDNFYLDDDRFNTLDLTARNNYTWAKDAVNDNEWSGLYQVVLNATTALETVEGVSRDATNAALWDNLKGAALFYRGYALFQAVEYYADIYDSAIAAAKPGIPLRTSSDVTIPSERASLEVSWQHIVASFKDAIALLPLTAVVRSRPTKAAAWAALARTYLYMNEYTLAGAAADSCLHLYHKLIDFNTVDSTSAVPFSRFNDEVIFPCVAGNSSLFDPSIYTLDTLLYASYSANDLRRAVYFTLNGYNGYGYKANYDGDIYSGPFTGIATDEVMLIKAECLARTGNTTEAINALNSLLVTRWRTGTFVPYTASNTTYAVQLILQERRKELILRGTRWFDLRRLSNDAVNVVQPVRHINNENFALPPGSNRYTFLIPAQVIGLTGMEQNVR